MGDVMKRYSNVLLFAFLAQLGLFNIMYAVKIVPTTLGDNAIVDAIKRYSDLSEADVNQWKLIWLGRLGTTGAFLAGAASAVGAGAGAYQHAGMVQGIAPEGVPGWVTNALVLAGVGSAGAGYVSYKMLNPRLRAGVLAKVQRLIDVCEDLINKKRHTIAYDSGNSVEQIKTELLPDGWSPMSDVAVYNALVNLFMQAQCARILLNQIDPTHSDVMLQEKRDKIDAYVKAFENNKDVYEDALEQIIQKKKQAERAAETEEQKKKREAAELAVLQATVGEKQAVTGLVGAKTTETYGQMVVDSIKGTWSGLNYIYKNKEKILYRLGVLSAAAYGAYTYAKSQLGYGQ